MMELFLRASNGSLAGDVLALAAPAAARAGDSALLARPLACADSSSGPSSGLSSGLSSGTTGSEWIARHSRPEVGFPSVELTLPWLATAVAGVNAAGLAALVAPVVGSTASAKPSVLLLVQECLQRFDDVTGCIDWCLKRPLAGAGSIVVGDESGAVAAVEVAGEERRLVSPGTRVLVTGGAAEQHDGLRRSLEPGAMPDAVGAALGAGVVLLPGDRSLRVRLFADGPEESLQVDM